MGIKLYNIIIIILYFYINQVKKITLSDKQIIYYSLDGKKKRNWPPNFDKND